MQHFANPVRAIRSRNSIVLVSAIGCLLAACTIGCLLQNHAAGDLLPRKPIHIEMGTVRPPLPYRIVSFHRGRADKRLVRLAAELGFNGVQIQIEGSTVALGGARFPCEALMAGKL
jgi:hypothetical protein